MRTRLRLRIKIRARNWMRVDFKRGRRKRRRRWTTTSGSISSHGRQISPQHCIGGLRIWRLIFCCTWTEGFKTMIQEYNIVKMHHFPVLKRSSEQANKACAVSTIYFCCHFLTAVNERQPQIHVLAHNCFLLPVQTESKRKSLLSWTGQCLSDLSCDGKPDIWTWDCLKELLLWSRNEQSDSGLPKILHIKANLNLLAWHSKSVRLNWLDPLSNCAGYDAVYQESMKTITLGQDRPYHFWTALCIIVFSKSKSQITDGLYARLYWHRLIVCESMILHAFQSQPKMPGSGEMRIPRHKVWFCMQHYCTYLRAIQAPSLNQLMKVAKLPH